MLQNTLSTFLNTAHEEAAPSSRHGDAVMESFFSLHPITIPQPSPPIVVPPSQTVPNNASAKKPEREILVARYGKIYKRKAPDKVNSIKTKCAPGFKYCKMCDKELPLSAFYTSVQRYVCKMHHAARVCRRFHERVQAKSLEDYVIQTGRCMSWNRIWFGYDKLRYDRNVFKEIIVHAKIPLALKPIACPIDPALPMWPRNVAVLSRGAHSLLLRLYQHTCSRVFYIAFVQRCNLVPRNLDVGMPYDPFHDPSYLRADIALGPLFEQEAEKTHVETADTAAVEIILEKQNKKHRSAREDLAV
jgi:hypothetical protein